MDARLDLDLDLYIFPYQLNFSSWSSELVSNKQTADAQNKEMGVG
jgi:hypothetical protein